MLTKKERDLLRDIVFTINHLIIEDNRQRALLREEYIKAHPDYFNKRTGQLKKAYKDIVLPFDL